MGGTADFRHLLSNLEMKYEEMESLAQSLRQERDHHAAEASRLRDAVAALPNGSATKVQPSPPSETSAEGLHLALPQALPQALPLALPGTVETPSAWQEHKRASDGEGSDVGVVTVGSLAAHGQADGVYFVMVKADSGAPKTTPLQSGPDVSWADFVAELPVMTSEGILKLELLESRGKGTPARSVGVASIPVASLTPGCDEKRRQTLGTGVGALEFRVSWRPTANFKPTSRFKPTSNFSRSSTAKFQSFALEARKRANKLHSKNLVVSGGADHWLDDHDRESQRRRFREIFRLEPEEQQSFRITKENLVPVLCQRGLKKAKAEWVDLALREMKRFVNDSPDLGQLELSRDASRKGTRGSVLSLVTTALAQGKKDITDASIGFDAFVDAIYMAELPNLVSTQYSTQVRQIQETMLKHDLEEVIAKLSRKRDTSSVDDYVGEASHETPTSKKIDFFLSILVSVTVLFSVVCLGISQDYWAESNVWPVLEALCAVVFISEIVLKCALHGIRVFWWIGPERYWNWLDVGITTVAVVDVVLSNVATATNQDAKVGRLALALRVFRLLRLARVLKVLRSPFIRELSNMLVGMVLGSPALFWVSIVIWFVVGLIAMGIRMMIGPVPGAPSRIGKCGYGDDPQITFDIDSDCASHELYAEEYCGTIAKCMFTVFRCMTGECATQGGQSLPVHLSAGFGLRFDITYAIGMVILLFGLFNVITAIFVEATLAGLKYNEAKQKLRSQYEARYVGRKLRELVRRVQIICSGRGNGSSDSLMSRWFDRATDDSAGFDVEVAGDIELSEEHFFIVMQDHIVRTILVELDIEIEGAGQEALFEMMDSSSSGKVDLASMIDMLMKLRGGPMKIDLIAPWIALKGLRQEFRDLALKIGKTARTLTT